MATKGSKTGAAKPSVRKPVARPATTPPAKAAAPKAEKPAPAVSAEPAIATPVAAAVETQPEPVPAVEAAPQEVIEKIETVAEPIVAEITETATITAEAAPQAAASAVKESTMIENNTAKAQAMFADFNNRTKAAVEKSTKLVEEANDFAKGNVEAIVESSKIAAKGFETLGQDAAEFGRKSFESATAALRTFASVKSPTELFKLQSDFLRTSFDSYVAEASKNTEAFIKLASDAAQPLSNRVAVAAEKVKTAA